jgi:hypothetical protein
MIELGLVFATNLSMLGMILCDMWLGFLMCRYWMMRRRSMTIEKNKRVHADGLGATTDGYGGVGRWTEGWKIDLVADTWGYQYEQVYMWRWCWTNQDRGWLSHLEAWGLGVRWSRTSGHTCRDRGAGMKPEKFRRDWTKLLQDVSPFYNILCAF